MNELEAEDDDPAIRRINEIDWATYPTRENSRGEHVYGTPIDNVTTALTILKRKRYSPEDKNRYVEGLIAQSLRQQDRGENSGRLLDDSKACKTAAGGGGPPDEPGYSSSHRGDAKDPKIKLKDFEAVSRTGSNLGKDGKEREHEKHDFTAATKRHSGRAGQKDPLEEER